jgi:hypothetical protein
MAKKKNKKTAFLTKIRRNKRGYSIGWTWIYSLVTLFGIGLLYIVFNQVFTVHLVPTIKSQVNSTAAGIDLDTQNEINGEIDKYMDFFHAMPFILFIVVVIYMIIAAFIKEKSDEYY